MDKAAPPPFLVIDYLDISYSKEGFLELMAENGIKCENCVNWTPKHTYLLGDGTKLGRCLVCRFNCVGEFFCKGFIRNSETSNL